MSAPLRSRILTTKRVRNRAIGSRAPVPASAPRAILPVHLLAIALNGPPSHPVYAFLSLDKTSPR